MGFSLAGIAPKKKGEAFGLEPGWHKVVTGSVTLEYVGTKYTPKLRQELFTVEDGKETVIEHWLTEKCIGFYADYVSCLGCDEAQRATMDPADEGTLTPTMDKTLWVMVDFEQNNKTGKWYRQVTHWAPDGDSAPTSPLPKHWAYPGGGGGGAPSQVAGSSAPASDDDIPF